MSNRSARTCLSSAAPADPPLTSPLPGCAEYFFRYGRVYLDGREIGPADRVAVYEVQDSVRQLHTLNRPVLLVDHPQHHRLPIDFKFPFSCPDDLSGRVNGNHCFKTIGIGIACCFLTLTENFRSARIGLWIVFGGYSLLLCWHLYLLSWLDIVA